MTTDRETIEFDRPKLERLKAAHAKAVEQGLDAFEFEGWPLLASYAKYLIEYLEGSLT
jgi:hypothetical protein